MNIDGLAEGFAIKCAEYQVDPMLIKEALDPQLSQILGVALPALAGGGLGYFGARSMGLNPWAGALTGAGLGGLGGHYGDLGGLLQRLGGAGAGGASMGQPSAIPESVSQLKKTKDMGSGSKRNKPVDSVKKSPAPRAEKTPKV